MDFHISWGRFMCPTLGALFLIAVGGAPVGAQEAPVVVDIRERVILPEPARNAVLAEMRLMLRSVSDILGALSEGDMSAAAQAARASGMGAAIDVDPGVREMLPGGFVRLGVATHQGFDALADRLEQTADQQAALADLAALTENCVDCHVTYRVDVTY